MGFISSVRQQGQASEKKLQLPKNVMRYMYRERMFKLFVPDELNGRMTSLPDALRIFEEASYLDGSFGWLVTIGSGGGYFCSFMQPEIAQKLFVDERAVVAGSGQPSGMAAKTEGGYTVSGSWKYCSGANYATIFTANCMIPNPQGEPTIKSFIFLPEQVEIVKDWRAFGMKATASHTIRVKDIFVPDNMTFEINTASPNYDYPIYRFPFLQFAECSFAAVSAGICRHFMDEASAFVEQYSSTWDAAHSNRSVLTGNLIQEKKALLEKETTSFYQTVEQAWTQLENEKIIAGDLLQLLSTHAKQVNTVALQCAQNIFPYLGMNALMEHTDINRAYRDLHVAAQHVLLKNF